MREEGKHNPLEEEVVVRIRDNRMKNNSHNNLNTTILHNSRNPNQQRRPTKPHSMLFKDAECKLDES